MNIIDIDINYKSLEDCYIALGNFDGVHLAHKKILNTMVENSNKDNVKSSILIFNNHTKNILANEKQRLLSSNNQKFKILKNLGIDIIYKLNFDDEFMKISPKDFISKFLVENLKVRGIFVGYDYKFGYKAKGNVELLKKLQEQYKFKLIVVEPVIKEENIISSTLIRNLIESGKIDKVKEFLGYDYSIEGKIVHGKHLGSKMGYPTANLSINTNYVIPKFGVYYSKIIVGGKEYIAATNIGKNPTIENNGIRIEAHILDFNKNIYGENVELILKEFIREEITFKSIDDLFKQIEDDVNIIRYKSKI